MISTLASRTILTRPGRKWITLLVLALWVFLTNAADNNNANNDNKTYYERLEIPQDASLQDIKKAYRRLALLHHPDRNRGREKEAEVVFRDISEAYEVLSDEGSRQKYDRSLRHRSARSRFEERHRKSARHRDPFAQFNDLFQNDEFFKQAFQGMDDLFTEMFEKKANNNNDDDDPNDAAGVERPNEERSGGGGWGNIRWTSTSSSTFGGRSSTSYSSSGGGANYEKRSSRTVMEHGRRVTIQSIEKDGNRIEEKYVGETLIERTINGELSNHHQHEEEESSNDEF